MKRRLSPPSLEVLESRIAPAQIYIGITASGFFDENNQNTEYKEVATGQFHPFHFTDTSTSGDLISAAVESAATSNTFFLRLSAGDGVQFFTIGGNYEPGITVSSGNVVAFFTDYNFNGDYDPGEFTGLAMGKNAKILISGVVSGDVATNLDEHGTKDLSDDTLDMTGLVSPKQGISNLAVTGGSVFGKVLSGGDIKKVTVAGNVEAILAGSAANGALFDFFPDKVFDDGTTQVQPGGGGAVSFTATPGINGAAITNALIESITDRMEAGSGGAGAVGGKISNVRITSDTDGFSILAGHGGAADAGAGKSKGGKGGDISKIYISGVVDNTPNSVNDVVIGAGDGGDGLASSTGGKGGAVSKVFVGFGLNGQALVASGDLLGDSVHIFGGGGGAGKIGGAGGGVSGSKVRVITPDVNGDEISVRAGDGGDSLAPLGGRGGVGGAAKSLDLRNQVLTFDSDIFVGGGNGGNTVGDSAGAAGGLISNITLLGFDLQLVAGSGSDGKTGGKGGALSNIGIITSESILAHNVLLNSGKGGNASSGNAGNGGNVQGIRLLTSDIAAFIVNSGLEGDGGTSGGGRGGKGGLVSNLDLSDGDTDSGIAGNFNIRSGHGGDGSKGGGAGGAVTKTSITSRDADLIVTASDGGSATVGGKGGNGGKIQKVQLTAFGFVGEGEASGTITSGAGGSGLGNKGSGGKGGDVQLSTINVQGDGAVNAGSGGSGQTAGGGVNGGAAGSGGSILLTGVFAMDGSGVLRAGDAGVDGALPGNGGSIIGNSASGVNLGSALSGLRAATSLLIEAGDGSHGGKGGSIRGIAYGSTATSLTPTPTGDILIKAGDGSGEGNSAGAGGSITNVFGSVGSGMGTTTAFFGGNGGGSPTKAGPGGSVSNVLLSLGGGEGVTLTFQAGDGGTTSTGNKGGNGGNVTGIGVIGIDPFTNFRSVAAGDGGDAVAGHGGKGGSVQRVAVENHDIGVRTGEVFGFATMGGIFAGAGGESAPGFAKGANGSVTQINANSISSIVAGRTLQPELVKSVSNIFLNNDNLLLSRNGAFAANGSFRLTFGPDTTDLILGNATRQQVEAKLNAINSITLAGGVNVSYSSGLLVGNTPSYIVTWKLTGEQVPLTGIEQLNLDVTEVAKGGLTTPAVVETVPGDVTLDVSEIFSGQRDLDISQTVPGDQVFTATEITAGDVTLGTLESEGISLSPLQAFPKSQFTLSFGGLTTVKLPQNATAAQIDAALEGLATIAATNLTADMDGAVTVSPAGTPLTFNVTFTNAGPQEIITGDFLFPESQRLNLRDLPSFPGAQFTLSFNGEATPSIAIGNSTPVQLAAQIQAALNGLTAIKNTAAPVGGVGSVKVSAGQSGIFNITFDTTLPDSDPNDRNNGDQPEIVGSGQLLETQQIKFGILPNDPDAVYTLSFEGETTAKLPVAGLSASQIETALDGLATIQNISPGGVTVTDVGNGAFSIVFKSIGDKSSISGIGFEHEFQSLDLGTLVTVPSGDFLLSFNGETTAMRLPGGASAQQIEDALNALVTIQNSDPDHPLGSVDVTATSTPGVFNIEFSALGNEPDIMASGFIHETQNVDIYAVGDFQLTLGNDTSSPLPATASAAAVDAALEAMPSIQALGGPAGDKVEVVANPTNSPNSSYNVTFHGDGDILSLSGRQFEPMIVSTKINGDPSIHEQQIVSYLPKSEFDAETYGLANLVGAIADINEIDSAVFHYSKPGVFDSPGHLQVFADGGFQLGYIPIDGILMAQVLNQNTLNFVPEAKLTGPTGAVFFDNDNVI
jgi:hypothetical protein